MRKAEKLPSEYVVYPAALFDGWEVVKERDDKPVFFDAREEATVYAKAQAAKDGGAVVKLENWFGDTESVWEVQPQTRRRLARLSRRFEQLSDRAAHGLRQHQRGQPFSHSSSKDRTMSDNITSILNDLIETSKDGEKGFRAAAENTKNAELQALFLRRAGDCGAGAGDCSNW